jgi:hypothetical protein
VKNRRNFLKRSATVAIGSLLLPKLSEFAKVFSQMSKS